MRRIRFGDWSSLLLYTLCTSISAGMFGLMTYFLRDLTDMGYEKNIEGMMNYAVWILGLIALGFISRLIEKYYRVQYIKKSNLKLKTAYLEGLMDQDITQLQKENTPIYRSQMTQDMDRYETKFFSLLLDVLNMSAQVIVSLILLLTVDGWIALLAIVLLVVFGWMTSRSGKPIQEVESKKSLSLNAYTSFLEESLEGFEVIKSHQLEESILAHFESLAHKVQDDNYLIDEKTTVADTINISVQMLVIFVAVVSGLLFARSTGSSLGSIIVVVSSFSNVMWPMQQISPALTQMTGIQEVLRQFDQTLHHEVVDRPLSVESFERLEFKETNLGYDEIILNQVNLEVKANQKILIVGPSGAGKSTILKTIRQSIMPLSGGVTLNQHDIFAIKPVDYYRLFASVDQVGFIFNGTLRDNITLYQTIDEEKIKASLLSVGLDELSLELELTNNGSNLSGGQRARLLSARALCLDASVIVCDEIFAALDGEVARSIEADLLKLDRTIINVSHIYFEASLKDYDEIYQVNNGEVKRVENHQVLVDMMLDASH